MPEIITNLHKLGIRDVILLADHPEQTTRSIARALGFDGHHASTTPEARRRLFNGWKTESRKILHLAETVNYDADATNADLTAVFGKASALASGSIQVVFLEEGLEKLCMLREIAAELDRTVRRSWSMIVAPNVACIAGIFTMGFGIIISEITNNVAALAAVANGLLPLKDFVPTDSQPQGALQTRPAHGLDRKALRTQTQTAAGRPDP
jgi:Cu2+-exporting ATPase